MAETNSVIDLAEWRRRMRTVPVSSTKPAPSVTAAMLQRSSHQALLDLYNGASFADRLLEEARNFDGGIGGAALRAAPQDEPPG